MALKIRRVGNDQYEITRTETVTQAQVWKLLETEGVDYKDVRSDAPKAAKAPGKPSGLSEEDTKAGEALVALVRSKGTTGVLAAEAALALVGKGDARAIRRHILAAKALEPQFRSEDTSDGKRYSIAG